jgi:hypothetical protein
MVDAASVKTNRASAVWRTLFRSSPPPTSTRAILLGVIGVLIIYPGPERAGTREVVFSPQRRKDAEISAEKANQGTRPNDSYEVGLLLLCV